MLQLGQYPLGETEDRCCDTPVTECYGLYRDLLSFCNADKMRP